MFLWRIRKNILELIIIALVKALFSIQKYWCFSDFSTKTYVEVIYVVEALLMSTHNICFRGEIRKIFTGYPPLSRPMWVIIKCSSLLSLLLMRLHWGLKADVDFCWFLFSRHSWDGDLLTIFFLYSAPMVSVLCLSPCCHGDKFFPGRFY